MSNGDEPIHRVSPEMPTLLGQIDGIWAVDKPAHVNVHPVDRGDGLDVVTWLNTQPDLPPGLAPVHRLDAQTSGVVLCAADPQVRRRVGQWFVEGQIQKRYLALVNGISRRQGVIRRPLKDARRRRHVDACTRYRRWESFGTASLLEVHPETGRKHQIRRHLHGIGHSVVGDGRYRSRSRHPVWRAPRRLWLHAVQVVLPDGTEITAPLPDELQAHLDVLRQRALQSNGQHPELP